MENFPEELCGLWCDEDGKAVYITKTEPLEFRTAIIFDLFKQLEKKTMRLDEHLKQLVTRWAQDEKRGVFRLQIEAGINFVGPTYNLYVSNKNEKPQNFDFSSYNVADVRLYPEVQMGLYDDWDDDLGVPWGFPYKNYEKPPTDIVEKFKKLVQFNSEGLIV